jgi:hypothetical protein
MDMLGKQTQRTASPVEAQATGRPIDPLTPNQPLNSGSIEVGRIGSIVAMFSKVFVPTTILTSLLYYFGWTFTTDRNFYLGLDPSILGLSMQDYLLRSIVPIFSPLSAILLVALAAIWLDKRLSRWIEVAGHNRMLGLVSGTITAAGLLLAIIGVGGAIALVGIPFILPVALALGPATFSYGLHLRRAIRERQTPRGQQPSRSTLTFVIIVAFSIIGIFGLCTDWAKFMGRVEAQRLLASRPRAVVFSAQQLLIDGPGVSVAPVGGSDAAYRYRYSGLRLLRFANGNYVLLPEKWSHKKDSAIVLPNKTNIRLEFEAP